MTMLDVLRYSSWWFLGLGLMILVIVIGIGLTNHRELYNFFNSPPIILQPDLLKLTEVDKYYVRVRGDDSFDTGHIYARRDRNGRIEYVENSYAALDIDGELLLVKTSGRLPLRVPKEFTGLLVPIPLSIRGEVISKLPRERRMAILPFMLDTTDFRTPILHGLMVAAVFVTGSLFMIYRGLAQGVEMRQPPLIYSLARLGDLDALMEEINAELVKTKKVGSIRVTSNWVIIGEGRLMNGVRLDDLVWIYKRRLENAYEMVMWDCYERCITIRGDENSVNQMVMTVYENTPWVYAGFEANTEAAWRRNRHAMIAEVEQRRKQYLD
jgi:hypothetical protein